ncbi:glycosyltransferase family 2 protein [Mycetocola spongiae]|uniref:glycosyltransferase family 2 protein n=1 Tax=Mycetocola spongiae TaxID=2859226 RepID=UPI001CF468D0|nr:glycosyltransferase family 2 protein [Mycetocola spongiae]UCR89699.1 glycosyltransferase family 2 protein [Mycetocola spongiae]
MKLSVVVPCYRSAATLPELTTRLGSSLDELVFAGEIERYEIILVVDGDIDGTGDAADSSAESQSFISVVHLRRNFGQHNALLAGIRLAEGDVIVTLDDDLQHPPEEIGKLIAPFVDPRVDLVYALPEVEEHGFFRSFASRSVKRALALAGVANAEWVGAFRAFRSELREGFSRVDDSQVNLDVLLSWTTSSVVPVTVSMDRRETGRSSYSVLRLAKHAMNMITGYGSAPLTLATWLGFICGAFGLIMLLTIGVRFLLGYNTVAGYTTMAGMISLFAGAQMLTIGIIGEYLGRQHLRSMGRPMYLIRKKI